MGELKTIKVREDTHKLLKKIAEMKQCSIAEAIDYLVNLFFGGGSSGEKAIKAIKEKDITNAFEGLRCSRCGRPIPVGELVHWIRYEYVDGSAKTVYLCFECAHPQLGKLYLKKKELETVVKQLRKEADSLVKQIQQMKAEIDLMQIKQQIMDLWKQLSNVATLDQSKVNMLFDKLNELIERVENLEMILKLSSRGRRRKVEEEEEVEVVEEHV